MYQNSFCIQWDEEPNRKIYNVIKLFEDHKIKVHVHMITILNSLPKQAGPEFDESDYCL